MPADWARLGSADTRSHIALAARQMGSLVRSTLGPMGRDKMIVRRMQDDEIRAMVTNDGIAIIEEFEGETQHPIAQRFIELTEAQEDDYGDGTTTVVVLASELLSTGMDLVDEGVHPTDVVEGFSIAAQRTLERWAELSIPLENGDGLDRELLREIALTGMTNGRTGSWPLGDVAEDVVEAVLRVSDPEEKRVRLQYATTVPVSGGDAADTEVIDGVLVPKEVPKADYLLPKTGKVLLVEGKLGIRSPKAEVNVVADDDGDATGATRFRDPTQARAIVDRIADAGVVAVVVGGDVDHDVVTELSRRGAICLRNVHDTRLESLARLTGGTPVGSVTPSSELDPDRLGTATVDHRRVKLDDEWVSFRSPPGAETPPAATIVVRGGTERAAREAERRIKDGKNALRAAIVRPEALPAGGAADIDAALAVRDLAPRFGGREQLAIEAFADVIETIPRTLAENAGLDVLDTLADLRARHDAGHPRAGLSTDGDLVDDVTADEGGIDAYLIRTTSLVRAMEFVNSLLRIDDTLIDQRSPYEQSLEEATRGH